MKLRIFLFFAGVMIGSLAPSPAGAAEKTFPHDLLCNGPISSIADDDPGLALFADSPEPLIDRKIALAIERANSCNEEDRNPLDRVRDLLDELAIPEPANGQIRALLYEIETEGQFVCDDHPSRCYGDDKTKASGQPWSCEDFIANDETPAEGCAWETGAELSVVSVKERLDVAESKLCPNGINDWDAKSGPACD